MVPQASQRSVDYTSNESDHNSVVKFVTINTDDSKEEIIEPDGAEPNSHVYKPETPARLLKGEMNIDLTPVHASHKELEPIHEMKLNHDMTKQPSFQVSPI